MTIQLDKLQTEQRNPHTMRLDEMSALEIVTEMNREDLSVPKAIAPHLNDIATVAEWGSAALERGGRILYMGAGTSGRLGVLDASECPPTFGVAPDRVVGLIAGGQKALTTAVEGAEDDREAGINDLKAIGLSEDDIVIGIAASGRTPYVVSGLEYAGQLGCHTAAIACTSDSAVGKAAEIPIEIITGPEVLTGSTRLKAGTAEKMVLNMISTAAMIGIGKSYENLMVDVVLSNQKLKARGERIVMEATGVDRETADRYIQEADGRCKLAITMILTHSSKDEARALLEKAKEHVRRAVEEDGRKGENHDK